MKEKKMLLKNLFFLSKGDVKIGIVLTVNEQLFFFVDFDFHFAKFHQREISPPFSGQILAFRSNFAK